MPALINAHTHLEFCANKTTLAYGNFVEWLASVIENREKLASADIEELVEKALKQMLRYGVSTVGAISSFGKDLTPCMSARQKIVYFNEILGSKEESIVDAQADFDRRLERSLRFKSEKFFPAISVHSAYSTHPKLVDIAVAKAKELGVPLAVHFMESKGERGWLDGSSSEFKVFFKKVFGVEKSLTTSAEFLDRFEGAKTMFIHCVYATEDELERIKYQNASVAHCPISNRLLNSRIFDIERAKNLNIDYITATDGLSSNFSLNLFNEIRMALFMYHDLSLKVLSYDLLESVTRNPAKALGLNAGVLESGKAADIIALRLPDKLENDEALALQIILHTNEVERIYIDGEEH
jgi:aminodeoxyfutalosine deaminase